jgi:putative transposase
MALSVDQRKEAMLLYYQQVPKIEICRRLGCSRPTLDHWLACYDPDAVDASLQNQPPGPHPGPTTWSRTIRQQVLRMRRLRCQPEHDPYALRGAAAIHYELQALGSPEVPPIRTIHRWLVAAGLVAPRQPVAAKKESKAIPLPAAAHVNAVQQLDLKGPIYLRGSAHKYYVAVLRDRYSHRCALAALPSREACMIVAFVVASWLGLGLPDYLQLDNALEFRGSNRYPRSFGRLVRVALDLGVEPVFNPPGEPWRNGGVERFNGFLAERLLSIEFADFAAFAQEVQRCQDTCNQTHRLEALGGRTPDECVRQTALRRVATTYQRHEQRHLPQRQGFVSFVRLIRKSGRITLGTGDRFMVDPKLAYSYVRARVDVAKRQVQILQNDKVLKTYDYSLDTIGAWADGAPVVPAHAA